MEGAGRSVCGECMGKGAWRRMQGHYAGVQAHGERGILVQRGCWLRARMAAI